MFRFAGILRRIAASYLYVAIGGMGLDLTPAVAFSGSKVQGPGTVHIALTSNRHLDMEPCGCTLKQFGGIYREANILAQWRREKKGSFLVLASGTTFVPLLAQDVGEDFLRLKRQTLIDAFNELGMNVLSPAAQDAAIPELGALRERAKFEFVSANLFRSGKPIFKTHHWLEMAGEKIFVTGLAHQDSVPGIEVKDPIASLKAVLSENAGKAARIIVLSGLEGAERTKIVDSFAEVDFIFGGPEGETTFTPEQLRPDLLYLNPESRGRGVYLTSVTAAKSDSLHNETLAAATSVSLESMDIRMQMLREQKKLSRVEKSELADLAHKKTKLQKFPLKQGDGVGAYETEQIMVRKDYDLPANSVSKLLDRFRAATRSLALDAEAE